MATSQNTVEGNYIGTDPTGTYAIPFFLLSHRWLPGSRGAEDGDGIYLSGTSNNIIGGTTPGGPNVISGNNEDWVQLGNAATNNQVQGNYIGVDATGTQAPGNALDGIEVARQRQHHRRHGSSAAT